MELQSIEENNFLKPTQETVSTTTALSDFVRNHYKSIISTVAIGILSFQVYQNRGSIQSLLKQVVKQTSTVVSTQTQTIESIASKLPASMKKPISVVNIFFSSIGKTIAFPQFYKA